MRNIFDSTSKRKIANPWFDSRMQ